MSRQTCEFCESDFIGAIYRQLGIYHHISKHLQLRQISQAREKFEGYDATLQGSIKNIKIKPIYIQFKRSDFNTFSPHSKIAEDRKKVFKNKNDYYDFELHRANESPTSKLTGEQLYSQHNLLFKLNQKYPNTCCYVAPLFHTQQELNIFECQQDKLMPLHIFKHIFYDLSSQTHRIKRIIKRNRMLKDTISIIPHKKITDRNSHRYTFNKNQEIGFHSEMEQIENNVGTFADFLINTIEQSSNTEFNPDDIYQILITGENPFLQKDIFQKKCIEFTRRPFIELGFFRKVLFLRKILLEEFDIYQFPLTLIR